MQKLITFKMEEKQLGELDKSIKKFGYSGRTEFLKQAIREQLHKEQVKQRLLRNLKEYYSKPKKQLTAEEYRKIGEESARKIAERFNIDLDE